MLATKQDKSALPWLSVPAAVAPSEAVKLQEVAGLLPALASSLSQAGFSTLFPVQAVAWHVLAGGLGARHDLCIAAPTGSGKTLAYVIPILQRCLAQPLRSGLQALVVVPAKALAQQVFDVFAALVEGIEGVSVVLANGTVSEAAEAAILQTGRPPCGAPCPLVNLASVEKQCGLPTVHTFEPSAARFFYEPISATLGCTGPVHGAPQVAVMTPGRLVHHLGAAHGHGLLRNLNILVIDEVDRLMRQDYHGWLGALMPALARPGPLPPRRIVKVLVSATLTHDPAKLGKLALHAPRFVALGDDVPATPRLAETLQEYTVTTAAGDKPHALIALLAELLAPVTPPLPHSIESKPGGAASGGAVAHKILVFAASVEVTHRLAVMLAACEEQLGVPVREVSSQLPAWEQRDVLQSFKSGATRVLVASDGMARGMDMPGVDCVISYDMPSHAKTYIHRAGRTARAGLRGRLFTLLRKEHYAAFQVLLRKMRHSPVPAHRIDPAVWSATKAIAEAALISVRSILDEEEAGEVHP